MRSLVKPSLFWIARIGLFLAVVAWIVGHFHVGQATLPYSLLECHSSGWVLTISDEFSDLTFLSDIDSRPKTANPDYDILSGRPDMTTIIRFPGFRCQLMGAWHTVYVKHWLILTITAAFYGTLKYGYRHRNAQDDRE